eukprot:539546-Pelagomonas_calceolata.AAC.1
MGMKFASKLIGALVVKFHCLNWLSCAQCSRSHQHPKGCTCEYIHLVAKGDLWVTTEGFADFFIGKLRGWVASFRIGVWGSGLYGIDWPLSAIAMVARGIIKAKIKSHETPCETVSPTDG